MNLATAANVAQLVSIVPLALMPAGLYWHHRCSECWRLTRSGRSGCRRHAPR